MRTVPEPSAGSVRLPGNCSMEMMYSSTGNVLGLQVVARCDGRGGEGWGGMERDGERDGEGWGEGWGGMERGGEGWGEGWGGMERGGEGWGGMGRNR